MRTRFPTKVSLFLGEVRGKVAPFPTNKEGPDVKLRSPFILATGVLTILAGAVMPAVAAPLPIEATAVPMTAADGNANEAVILVYLGNADGTPKTNAEIPKPSADPNGGVELKGSKWSFETLWVPDSYAGKVRPDYRQAQLQDMKGQLRILQIYTSMVQISPTESRTLYVLRVFPRYGFQGGQKAPLVWRSGTYNFRVTYKDGNDQGTALGTLTIR
jgi:hypothetical protein